MKTKLIQLIVVYGLLSLPLKSQSTCLNNPSIQAGDIDPAPLRPDQNGILSLSYNHGGQAYGDYATDPVEISICFANITTTDGVKSVGGTIANKFSWSINNSQCLIGIQQEILQNNDGGSITIEFRQTNPISCPKNQMGFIANIQPPQCMNSTDLKGDNSERSFTCVNEEVVDPDDADTNPEISISNVTVIEGQNAQINICLNQVSSKDISVEVVSQSISAHKNDYQEFSHKVVIPAGVACIMVTVPTYTDDEIENNEEFKLTLQKPTNATIDNQNSTGSVIIIDPHTVPTLGQWGLILLSLSLLIIGVVYLKTLCTEYFILHK